MCLCAFMRRIKTREGPFISCTCSLFLRKLYTHSIHVILIRKRETVFGELPHRVKITALLVCNERRLLPKYPRDPYYKEGDASKTYAEYKLRPDLQ